jgi:hypothetical protein
VEEKLREKFVSAIEKSVLTAGAKDYEEGMQTARKLLGWAHDNIQSVQTRDDLRKVLDSCPPLTKREEVIALFVMSRLPQIMRFVLSVAAKKAKETIPSTTGGRPSAIPPEKIRDALDYVSALHRKGCSFEAAIKRTAQRFGTSDRTIERLWAKRESMTDDDLMPEVTIDEAVKYLSSGCESVS